MDQQTSGQTNTDTATATTEATANTGAVVDSQANAAAEAYPDDVPQSSTDEAAATQTSEAEGEGEQAIDPNDPLAGYTLEMPEGVELDQQLAGEFMPLLREGNVSQETAQVLATKMAEWRAQEVANMQNANAERFEKLDRERIQEIRNDPEVGRDNLETSRKHVDMALKTFGREGLGQWLGESRLGNHIEFYRFLANVGSKLDESGSTLSKPTTPQKTDAQLLYPND